MPGCRRRPERRRSRCTRRAGFRFSVRRSEDHAPRTCCPPGPHRSRSARCAGSSGRVFPRPPSRQLPDRRSTRRSRSARPVSPTGRQRRTACRSGRQAGPRCRSRLPVPARECCRTTWCRCGRPAVRVRSRLGGRCSVRSTAERRSPGSRRYVPPAGSAISRRAQETSPGPPPARALAARTRCHRSPGGRKASAGPGPAPRSPHGPAAHRAQTPAARRRTRHARPRLRHPARPAARRPDRLPLGPARPDARHPTRSAARRVKSSPRHVEWSPRRVAWNSPHVGWSPRRAAWVHRGGR